MTLLYLKSLVGLLVLLLVMAGLLFIPAGTVDFWQAWMFLAVYFASSLAITVYLMKRDPKLLERRMSGGPFAEKEPTQKLIMLFVSLGFIGLIAFPALDHRFAWSRMPPYMALAGDVLVALGFVAILFVFKENTFSSATIEAALDQKVISTGPYAIVRHPMYAGALVMLLGIPIALGSWWGLFVLVAMMPGLIWRLIDEERFLARKSVAHVAEALWMQALDEARRRAAQELTRDARSALTAKQDLEVRSHVLTLREGELDSRLKDRERTLAALESQLQELTLLLRKERATRDSLEERIGLVEDELLASSSSGRAVRAVPALARRRRVRGVTPTRLPESRPERLDSVAVSVPQASRSQRTPATAKRQTKRPLEPKARPKPQRAAQPPRSGKRRRKTPTRKRRR